MGLDGDELLAKVATPEYKAKLRANTDELIARGGFGSPTMFVDGDDMYFGNDRLVLVRDALARARAFVDAPLLGEPKSTVRVDPKAGRCALLRGRNYRHSRVSRR